MHVPSAGWSWSGLAAGSARETPPAGSADDPSTVSLFPVGEASLTDSGLADGVLITNISIYPVKI